ncbi:MAG: hypothetical protein EHM49_09115, partial [Deltaproteobacteria bacterium]
MPTFHKPAPPATPGKSLFIHGVAEGTLAELSCHKKLDVYIRRTKGLGDVLMAALVSHSLRRKLPPKFCKVHLITSPPYKKLITKLKLVDSVCLDGSSTGSFIVNLQDKVDYLPHCAAYHRLDLMAMGVGLRPSDVVANYRIKVDPAWGDWGRTQLKEFGNNRIIALAPWATAPIRSWPNWEEVVGTLLS